MTSPEAIFAGDSETASLMRKLDWSTTPLGPVSQWSQTLRALVPAMLASRFAMRIVWGPEFTLLYNDAYRPVLGPDKHPGAMASRTDESFAEVWSTVGLMFARVYGGEAVALEDGLLPLHRNGYLEECYFTLSYSPLQDDAGHIAGLLGVVHETTERVLAERRLLSLRELAAAASGGKSIAQAAWSVAAALQKNNADVPFALLYLCEGDGATLAARVGLDDKREVPTRITLGQDDPWGLDITRDEHVIDLRFANLQAGPYAEQVTSAVVIRLDRRDSERPYGFLVAGVNPRHRLDDDYRAFFALASEHIVTALATSLAHGEAEEARERLKIANRAKDEFLAMLGHELRNPLAPIATALQLMRMRGDTGLERERAIIERQVGHVTRLVDDLLDVSRITRGAIELKRESVALADVVSKAVEIASPLIEQRRHRLHVHLSDNGLVVDGDPVRLAQIVSNLLTNAAKYTEPGGEIFVTASESESAVELRVRDTGIGLDPPMLTQIFEPFVQEHQESDRAQGGLGLGLAIVRAFTEMHGGTIRATSAGRGHGADRLSLPPHHGAGLIERRAQPRAPEPARVPAASTRILVVDDNVDAAELLSESLRLVGYTTEVAHDGPTALAAAARHPFDVAVLDIGLPVMDGYELARSLRTLPGGDTLHLVALTGYGQASDRERSRAAGFAAHLVKPIQVSELRKIIAGLTAGASLP